MTELHAQLLQARADGCSLIRVVETIRSTEPWALAAAVQADGLRVMAWSSPESSDSPISFVAAGIATEFRPQGGDRFEEASRWWTQTATELIELDIQTGAKVKTGAPVCLAGFAFTTGLDRSRAWEGWDDGAICVPEIIVLSDGECTRAVYTLTPGQDLDHLEALQGRLQRWLSQPIAAPQPSSTASKVRQVEPSETDWSDWQDRVHSAQSSLRDGTMDKVVLARSEAYRTDTDTAFDPLGTAMALRDRQTDSTTFMIQRRDGQAFLGATPEILVRLTDRQVHTVAMAGTRRRGSEGVSDEALGTELLASAKDRLEQKLVADAICTALGTVVTDLQRPEEPEVVRLPDVQHLRTLISGTVRPEANIFDLLQRLHPTPAVGGLPREPALQWLDDNEALDRGWYAGPIGWVDAQGSGVFVVAIRSVLIADHEASAFAGCGLVAHSDARDEWEESVVKLQTVRRGLALQSGADS